MTRFVKKLSDMNFPTEIKVVQNLISDGEVKDTFQAHG